MDRIKGICLKPKDEWQVIAGETSTTADLLKNYALPLAAIGAAASFIGGSFVGTSFLIDKNGRVLKEYIGEPDWAEFHALVEKALGS